MWFCFVVIVFAVSVIGIFLEAVSIVAFFEKVCCCRSISFLFFIFIFMFIFLQAPLSISKNDENENWAWKKYWDVSRSISKNPENIFLRNQKPSEIQKTKIQKAQKTKIKIQTLKFRDWVLKLWIESSGKSECLETLDVESPKNLGVRKFWRILEIFERLFVLQFEKVLR